MSEKTNPFFSGLGKIAIFFLLIQGFILTNGCTGIFPSGAIHPQVSKTPEVQPTYPDKNLTDLPLIPLGTPEPTSTMINTPASDSDLAIIMDKTEIPINSTLVFYLENHGSLIDEFTSGYPFSVEYYGNSGWTQVAGQGGTQGFWKLEVGEKSRKMVWNTATVREYLAEGLINRSDVQESGRFRICMHAFVGGYPMNNEVQRCKEFIVTP